jgi:hypothetical protein
VGTDRRAPLLALILVAIVAGILLVTSVRSRAVEPAHASGASVAETVSSAPSSTT